MTRHGRRRLFARATGEKVNQCMVVECTLCMMTWMTRKRPETKNEVLAKIKARERTHISRLEEAKTMIQYATCFGYM